VRDLLLTLAILMASADRFILVICSPLGPEPRKAESIRPLDLKGQTSVNNEVFISQLLVK